ncbi:putative general substrate transporter [Rosellinia necatrix]|uniref:Putative general substrate transporter n=1 Tax=Rosellinia necatrix TaxID=77044 RepID=A0A1W2TQF5_ROSNE|nr:putative general substrate transporter [Rosellinia necatrix]
MLARHAKENPKFPSGRPKSIARILPPRDNTAVVLAIRHVITSTYATGHCGTSHLHTMFNLKTHHKRTLVVASHVSLAGLLYGLDTGSIGPITTMPQFSESIGHLTPTQQGVYVASILLAAAASSLASGHVSDAISRRYGILTGAILSIVGTVLSAASPNFAALIVARLISGAGFGQCIAVSTVYLVELAPKSIRGVAACMVQLYVVLGITVGYFISYGSQGIQSSLSWRLPFIIQAAIAAALASGVFLMPSSPRWLLQKGRKDDAVAVLNRYRATELKVKQELDAMNASMESNTQEKNVKFMVMFQKRYIKRTMLGVFLMSFQQLTGIDVVLYYAPIIFQQAGIGSTRATFLASGVSGIVMLVSTIPAQIWIDRWGRRRPLIYGGAAMSACLIIIGSLYAKFGERGATEITLRSTTAQWFVIVLTYIFVANFSWSWAVVGKIYSCEIIPTHIRAKVASLELLANWLVNFAVTLSAPVFLRSSPSGPYFLYGFATLVAVGVCIVMPETKGKSLEEIESDFEKSNTETLPESTATA